MFQVARSATFSRTASRGIPRPSEADLLGVEGVRLEGLGCSLAEWDRLAALLPESVRPARGVWSGAIEAAAVKDRQQRAEAAARLRRSDTFAVRAGEVRAALADGPLTIAEIAGMVGRCEDVVRATVMSLRATGDIAAEEAERPEHNRIRSQYRLTKKPSRSGDPRHAGRLLKGEA